MVLDLFTTIPHYNIMYSIGAIFDVAELKKIEIEKKCLR